MENKYDFIIIGGGISGLSAAMYGTRLGLKTLLLTEFPGGLITTTHVVENWPGIKSISGPDLAVSLYEHATESGAEIKNEKVVAVTENSGHDFTVKTSSGEYKCKTLLFATGTKHRNLNVPGEKEFENKGVSYCALCDGAFFKGKIVCVVGGGDSAAKEAIFLSSHAEKVYLIVRKDFLRAEPINVEKIENTEKIEVLYETEIAEIKGDEKVNAVIFKKYKGDNSQKEMNVDGIFLAIGHIAQTDLAKDMDIKLNDKGEIIIDRKCESSVKGVFAAGDCTDTEFKQAITGSAEGVTAAYYAYQIAGENVTF